jgi:tRNA A-37 threonylcarbamoyl transferase component Bud32
VEEAIAGIKLEKYKLLSKLSKGGMASVYLAEHELLKKKVAIKILLPELAKNEDMVERFLREARAAAGLNHPNIIKIHDVGQVKKVHYIAMDFIDGPRLTDHINTHGHLTEPEILRISRQVLGAISEAHANQIIHRDLKPQNIMLDHRGDVVIMDFGIAKAAYNSNMTATGSFLGTAKYASPEQVRGEKITPASDLYSWGIVMFEMVTGQTPFTGADVTTLIYQHLNKTPTAPVELNPEISQELNHIILKCLEKAPENRYATAPELWGQINQLASRSTWGGLTEPLATKHLKDAQTRLVPTPPAKAHPGGENSRRRVAKWVSMGAASVFCAVLLGWWSMETFNLPMKSQTSNSHQTPSAGEQIQKIAVPSPQRPVETTVEVWTEKKRYRVGDSIKIHFRARDDSYLFLYHEDALGRGQMIFPSQKDEDNFIVGGLTHTIPDPNASFDFIVQPPTGTERIKALSTASPEQAAKWRNMGNQDRLSEAKKQNDLLVFEVVN